LFNAPIYWLADITVTPDFNGLPVNLEHGLVHLTNNAAALLLLVSGLGIVASLIGLVVGHGLHMQSVSERSKGGLLVSAGAGAILFIAVAVANYAMGLFR
jgi:hypothetical protein